MKFSKTHIIPLLIIAASVLIMLALFRLGDDQPKRKHTVHPKTVDALVVSLGDVPTEIIVYGRLVSSQPVALISEVAGTIEAGTVPFLPGQIFKKGDLLLKIDDRQARYDLNSLKSDFLNALTAVLPELNVDFPEAYRTFQEYFDQIRFDRPLPVLPEAGDKKIKLYLTRFNVYKLYFSVKNQEIRLKKHYFYAPFDGSVISADLRIGSTARAGSQLGKIINLSSLEVEAPVPAQDIAWIDPQGKVSLSSAEIPGQWTGRIARIGKAIDEQTQTIPVYIRLDKKGQDRLYSGVFLTARIPGKNVKIAFSIPRRALYGGSNIYMIRNGRLAYRTVEVLRQQEDSVILGGGIQTGDTVITDILQGVAVGMPVRMRGSGTDNKPADRQRSAGQ